MRKPCAVVTLVALLATPLISAADHIVPAGAAGARLSAAAAQRQADLASLERALASPAGARAAARAGLGVGEARRSLASLGDQELRDLARRSAILGSDPAAGYHSGEVEDLLVILLLVALVVIVLRAAR